MFLWGVGFFAAAQLALVGALDRWHPTLTANVQANKWEQLCRLAGARPDRPLLVMLGSSRTDDAFEAERLNGLFGPGGRSWLAYNFGVPTFGPLRQGLYLDAMLQAGIRPRLLLVEFVPTMLNEPHRGVVAEENWTEAAWLTLPQVCRLWPYWAHPCRMASTWLEARLAPWYGLRIALVRSAFTAWFPRARGRPRFPAWECWRTWRHDDWGFHVPRPLTSEDLEHGWLNTTVTFSDTLGRLRLGEGSVRALRDLLETCRRERIAAALVFMPESTLFRSWYRPGALAEAHRLFADLASEYGVLPIDASTWVADTDFSDGHHVQAAGARAFTTRLIEELRPLLDREESLVTAAAGHAP